MREVPQIEAIKYALRQSKDGTVISFLIHPNDLEIVNELQCAPIGQRGMFGWYAVGDDEKPVAANAATIAAKPAENKPKRKFSELSLPEQCALRCDDGRFGRFLRERADDEKGSYVDSVDDIASWVRFLLGVTSRADLSRNHDAANKWRALEVEFQRWLTDQEYADVRR